jgi:hypothetical protein
MPYSEPCKAVRRKTPKVKEEMANAIRTAIEYFNHADMPMLPGRKVNIGPSDLARFLETDIQLITAPGHLQEKKYVLGDLQMAADYLNHPIVTAVPFSLNSSNVARILREIIRDLK